MRKTLLIRDSRRVVDKLAGYGEQAVGFGRQPVQKRRGEIGL